MEAHILLICSLYLFASIHKFLLLIFSIHLRHVTHCEIIWTTRSNQILEQLTGNNQLIEIHLSGDFSLRWDLFLQYPFNFHSEINPYISHVDKIISLWLMLEKEIVVVLTVSVQNRMMSTPF